MPLEASPSGARTYTGLASRFKSVCWALLFLTSIGLYLFATKRGLELGSDSIAYIAAARNFTHGYGFSWLSGGIESKPLVLHAPLYSMLIAVFESWSIDAIIVARVINGLAFTLTILLFGYLLHRMTRNWVVSILGAFTLMVTGEFLQVYAWSMSDPLFIALSLTAFVSMHRFLEDRRLGWFILIALSASAAYLTRYAGLSLVVALALVLFVAPRITHLQRFKQAAIFLIIGIAPTSLWFLRNKWLTGQIAGRNFGRNAASILTGIEQTVSIIFNWFLPLRFVEWFQAHPPSLVIFAIVGALGLIITCILGYRAWLKQEHTHQLIGLVILCTYILSYLGLLAYSYLFSRPGTDLIERTMSPIYPAVLALVILSLVWLWNSRNLWLRVLIILGCLLLIRNKIVYTYYVINDLRTRGYGYTNTAWERSETIDLLNKLRPEAVYTDDIAAIYYWYTPNVYLIPQEQDAVQNSTRSEYENELQLMRMRISRGKALLVLFRPDNLPPESAPFGTLVEDLKPIAILEDGVIYGPGE